MMTGCGDSGISFRIFQAGNHKYFIGTFALLLRQLITNFRFLMVKTDVVTGIDIGGTNTVFGFVNRKGEILKEGIIKTSNYSSIEDFISELYNRIILDFASLEPANRIIGFGVGAPMGNINKGTIEHAAGLPWKGVIPFVEILSRQTSLPIVLTNDANAAAVGEMVYGGARGMKDFVVITLGTGLGSGLW